MTSSEVMRPIFGRVRYFEHVQDPPQAEPHIVGSELAPRCHALLQMRKEPIPEFVNRAKTFAELAAALPPDRPAALLPVLALEDANANFIPLTPNYGLLRSC